MDTDLVDVAVSATADSLNELVLVLGVSAADVTGQRVRVRGHRERKTERKRKSDERETEEDRGTRDNTWCARNLRPSTAVD